MLEILRLLAIPVAVVLTFVVLRVWLRGPRVLPELARSGFSLQSYFTGRGMRDHKGSSIATTKAPVVTRHEDGLEIRETINLSSGNL
jgi:hypothetical protein